MALAELIESELQDAILHTDKEAIRRFSIIISDRMEKVEENENKINGTQSDIRVLIEEMKNEFTNLRLDMEKRFEIVDKRFEAVDRRFEMIQKQMDERFRAVDKRFEDMNKRFDMMFKFMGLGFTILSLLIVLFKFIK